MNRRILVTGATGFLGGAILKRLGAEALGQGRSLERCAALGAKGLDIVQWNLPDRAPNNPKLDQVDAIVHCAGLSAPFGRSQAFHSANVLGTQSVLSFALERGVKRFVFVSSPSIYFALSDQLNVPEDMRLPRPFTPYAQSKIEAERLVLSAPEVGPIILRPRGIYGPGDTALLPRLLKAASVRPLPRFRQGRARIDLTFVDDVVDAVLQALTAEQVLEGRAFNVSSGEVLPVSQIVENVCAHAGIVARWRRMPLVPALVAARIAESLALMRSEPREPVATRYGLGLFAYAQSLDISRASNLLGWVPKVSFEEGLARTFDTGASG